MVLRPTQHKGFTLIELMVTIAIAAILLTIGVPSLTSFFDRQKVITAAEQVYSHLQQTKVEAISRSDDVAFVHNATTTQSTTFDYVITTEQSSCSLASDNCYLNINGVEVLTEYTNAAFSDVKISVTSNSNVVFDGTRGGLETPNIGFSFDFESPIGLKLRCSINQIGRIKLCSPDSSVSGYGGCE